MIQFINASSSLIVIPLLGYVRRNRLAYVERYSVRCLFTTGSLISSDLFGTCVWWFSHMAVEKFWDPELGRMRSRSGTGEIVEECVSRYTAFMDPNWSVQQSWISDHDVLFLYCCVLVYKSLHTSFTPVIPGRCSWTHGCVLTSARGNPHRW